MVLTQCDMAIPFCLHTGVSITLLVSGWFCEVGGCGMKGALREFIKISNVREEAEHTEKGLLDILVVLLNLNKSKWIEVKR